MRIIITGSNGFIGSALINLVAAKHEVIPIARKDKGTGENGILLDLADEQAVLQFIDKGLVPGADVIVHLAAVTAHKETVNDLSLLFANAAIAKSVALIGKAAGVNKLVNISSMAVYPNIDGSFAEDALPDPSTNSDCIYGLSKFNAEVLLNYFLRSSVPVLSHLRMAMVYGDGMQPDRIIPVLKKELQENNTATIFGNGERLLNLVEVNKAAQVINEFIERDLPGIYNVGDELVSLEQLSGKLAEATGGRLVKVEQGNRTRFRLDLTRLNSVIAHD